MIHVAQDKSTEPVLCVDLDGTLISTDLLWESVLLLIKTQPWQIAAFPFWIAKGRAYFKLQVSSAGIGGRW